MKYRQHIIYAKKCEQTVGNYFVSLGYRWLAQNLKTQFAEIDLLFLSPENEFVAVEAKSVRNFTLSTEMISHKQKVRLKKAYRHLSSALKLPVRVHFAAVDQKQTVQIYYDFIQDCDFK